MNKILTVLLIVATVIGMTAPAMANPQNEPIAVSKNIKDIFVEVEGAIPTNNNIGQTLTSSGALSNSIYGSAIGGDAYAGSANVGAANSGATSGVLASNDSMGDSDATAYDNLATVNQNSNAYANGGNPAGVCNSGSGYYDPWYGYGGGCSIYQNNNVAQNDWANINNYQTLTQPVYINEYQYSSAYAPGDQDIVDSMFNEDGWNKTVYKWIY